MSLSVGKNTLAVGKALPVGLMNIFLLESLWCYQWRAIAFWWFPYMFKPTKV